MYYSFARANQLHALKVNPNTVANRKAVFLSPNLQGRGSVVLVTLEVGPKISLLRLRADFTPSLQIRLATICLSVCRSPCCYALCINQWRCSKLVQGRYPLVLGSADLAQR